MKRAGWARGKAKGADEIFSASCQKLLQTKKWRGVEMMGRQVERKETESGDTLRGGTTVTLQRRRVRGNGGTKPVDSH